MLKKTMAYISPTKTRGNTLTITTTNEAEQSSPGDRDGSASVVLSNYPPNFTGRELKKLLAGFEVTGPLTLAKVTHFAYPLRTTIILSDREEALRVERTLHGKEVGGGHISVKMADADEVQDIAALVETLAQELKIAIMNAARAHYPHTADAVLEIREHTIGDNFYAFLQARKPITIHSEPDIQAMRKQNLAKWVLVASGTAHADIGSEKDKHPRLEALKLLREELKKRGGVDKIWCEWEGSRMLEMFHAVE